METGKQNYIRSAVCLVVFLANVCVAIAQRTRCESFCRFRFCANLRRDGIIMQLENRAFTPGIPNTGMGPFPCFQPRHPRARIRILRNVTGGEARVSPEFSGKRFVPISKFRRRKVNPDFSPNQIQWFDNVLRQGPGRIESNGNQERKLDKLCVQLPITSYKLLRRDGSVRKSVVTRGKSACVGFRTQVARLLVTFFWESADDFDMTLEEPNGFIIDRFGQSMRSPNGGSLVFDNGGNPCQNEVGRETIRYLLDATVESGTYIIRISRNRVCRGNTRYRLWVLYRGRVIAAESGVASDKGEDIIVQRFRIH